MIKQSMRQILTTLRKSSDKAEISKAAGERRHVRDRGATIRMKEDFLSVDRSFCAFCEVLSDHLELTVMSQL
jgi:hypothetical protein